MQSRSSDTPAEKNFVQHQNMLIISKPNMKEKKSTRREHTLGPIYTGFDLNQNKKTCNGKDTTSAHSSLMFDLNHKQHKNFSGKEEVMLRSSFPLLDLNQRERLYSGKEATCRSMTAVFDLNQISVICYFILSLKFAFYNCLL